MSGMTNPDHDLHALLRLHEVPTVLRDALKSVKIISTIVFANTFDGNQIEALVRKHGFKPALAGELSLEDKSETRPLACRGIRE